jgi:hypothetical protein
MSKLTQCLALVLWAAAVGLAGGVAVAQTLELRAYRVVFPAGTVGTTIRETIEGKETILYRIAARKGQVLQVTLESTRGTALFGVYGPGRGPGDAPIARSDELGPTVPGVNRFNGELSRAGDYTVAVTLVRSAANRGDRVPFTLSLRVTDGAVQLPGGPAVPDGPKDAFLKVTGVGSGDRLNVRSGPSTGNRVLFTLANGTVVRNLGCEVASGGMTWCKIHPVDQSGVVGWASASYLVVTRDPGSATQLPEVPGAGKPVIASGIIACVLELIPLDCRYQVTRRGGGDATLSITRPFARDRVIEFLAGRPVSSNASGEIYAEWKGSTVVVSIGQKERFTVPNLVLLGNE